MHICFLSEHFHKSPSGPRKACLELAETMLELGHRVSLIGIAPKTEDQPWTGSRPARLRRYTWKLIPVKIGRPRFFARELATLHKEEEIDVVLAMGLEAGAAALRFRTKHGVPFVLNPRSYLAEPIGHPKYKLAKKLTEQCNAFVALSNSACIAWYWRLGASVPENAIGVLNGCDPREHEGEVEPLPEVRLQQGVPLLLSVGMLRRPKGHHVVLRALAELRSKPWQLVIAGEGPARAELESDIVRHGLVGRVHLPGIVEGPRLRWLYRNASFFVLFPLYFEVCGNAFLEALAAGLPVLTSEAGATKEVLYGNPSHGDENGLTNELKAALGEGFQELRERGLYQPASALATQVRFDQPFRNTAECVRMNGLPDVDETAVLGDLVEALGDMIDDPASNSLMAHRADEARLRARELSWEKCARAYMAAIKHAIENKPASIRFDRSPLIAAWSV